MKIQCSNSLSPTVSDKRLFGTRVVKFSLQRCLLFKGLYFICRAYFSSILQPACSSISTQFVNIFLFYFIQGLCPLQRNNRTTTRKTKTWLICCCYSNSGMCELLYMTLMVQPWRQKFNTVQSLLSLNIDPRCECVHRLVTECIYVVHAKTNTNSAYGTGNHPIGKCMLFLFAHLIILNDFFTRLNIRRTLGLQTIIMLPPSWSRSSYRITIMNAKIIILRIGTRLLCSSRLGLVTLISVGEIQDGCDKSMLKALDNFGNCRRPVLTWFIPTYA